MEIIMKIKEMLLAILVLPQLLIGTIYETCQFEDVLTHVERNGAKKILVVCDVDNTLLKSAQHLGSVAWGDHMIAKLERKGVPKRQAEEIESIIWRAIQPYIKVQNVDPKTPMIMHQIQDKNVSIMALTARTPEETEYTYNQLLSVGINLADTFGLGTHRLDMEEHDALYDQGILFGTPFNKKSKVLFAFLDKHLISPELIIFVDDKRSHVEDLSQECIERNIQYVGIRFNGADEDVKNFDPLIAEIQWEVFPVILSDEQARQIHKCYLKLLYNKSNYICYYSLFWREL
jgi:hypothetical protein